MCNIKYEKIDSMQAVVNFLRDVDIKVITLDAKDLTVEMLDKDIITDGRYSPTWRCIIDELLYKEGDWQDIPRFIRDHIERLVGDGYIAYKQLDDEEYVIYDIEEDVVEDYGILKGREGAEVYIYNTDEIAEAYEEIKTLQRVLNEIDLGYEETGSLYIELMNNDLYSFVLDNTDLY